MTTSSVYVHGLGMACPVGLTAATACAAIRAGIDRKAELPYRDNTGEPIVGSTLSILELGQSSYARARELLAISLKDLFAGGDRTALALVPLMIVLPEGETSGWALAEFISQRTGIALDRGQVYVRMDGALGCYRALAEAQNLLLAGRHEHVIVAAADSLVTASTLLRLSAQGRLLTLENSDGIIPGEAAACLLLGRHSPRALAAIRGIGFGQEPGLLSNDTPLRGNGVVAAAQAALAEASLQLHDMDYRLSDAAGESYHFKEQALVVGRMLRSLKPDFPLWLIAESLGYVGAAAGLCNLVWAVRSSQRRAAPGPRAIAWVGDAEGGRAAVVLETMGGC